MLTRVYYYFQNMYNMTRALIVSCIDCNKNKGQKCLKKERQLFDTDLQVFQCLHCDHCGPLESSGTAKYRYIQVVVDRASSWISLTPLTNLTTKNVAKAMIRDVFSFTGVPERIITDNASYFRSESYQHFAKAFGFKPHYISVAHSQANSLAEHINYVVTLGLKGYVKTYKNTWSEGLKILQMYLNNSLRAVSGIIPNIIVMGKLTNMPPSYNLNVGAQKGNTLEENIYQRLCSQQEARKMAKMLKQENALKDKERHDSKQGHIRPLHIGQIVFYHCKHINRMQGLTKLHPVNHGPYLVLHITKKGSVTLRDLVKNKVLKHPVPITHLILPRYYKGQPNDPRILRRHELLDDESHTFIDRAILNGQPLNPAGEE